MKEIKKWMLNNKRWSVVIFLLFILLIIGIIAIKDLFFSNNGNVYGSRLNGIENVTITDQKRIDIVNELEAKNNVMSASVRIQGRIIYITIDVNKNTTIGDAKNISSIVLESFSKEEKSFYDFEFLLTQKEIVENEVYPTIGTKHKSVNEIVWVKSR